MKFPSIWGLSDQTGAGDAGDVGRELVPGQNLGLPAGTASIALAATGGVAFLCCTVGSDQRAASASDLVSLDNRSVPFGAVRLAEATPLGAVFEADLAAIPARVSRLVFLAARDESGPSSPISPSLRLSSGGEALAGFRPEAVSSPFVFVGEVYRRAGDWKFRAIGQEFRTVRDAASFLGLEPSVVMRAVGTAPPSPQAPSATTTAPLVSLSRPPRVPPPPPVAAARVAEIAVTPEAVPVAVAVADDAGAFAMRGWVLTSTGVVAGTAGTGKALVERELLDLRPGAGGAVWPGFFAHDPSTGKALAPLQTAPCSGQGVTNGAGLPEIDGLERLDAAGRREVGDVPMGARLFANGGDPVRLVAIDPWEGRCWWRAPFSREWVPLDRVPSAGRAPLSSLGAVGTPAGVFHAAGGTLAHVLVGQSPSVRLMELGGAHVAPPFAAGSVVAVPVEADARLHVAVMQAGGGLRAIDVHDAPSVVEPLGRPFGEPGAGRCFWLGSRGFLALDDVSGRVVARWNAWPPEVEGLPFLSLHRARSGRLWAFAVRTSAGGRSREGAVAYSLGVEGVRETKELPGPFLSVGEAAFRGCERFRDPWSAAEESEIPLGLDYAGRWLLPFLRIGGRQTLVGLVAEPRGMSTARAFVFREETLRTHDVALAIHTDNGGLELLRQGFQIGSTDDLDVFRDGDRICVNHAESGTCASWPLV